MAGHLAVVSAKKKSKTHGPAKHKHPVKRMIIEPTDNHGYSVQTEMHPTGGQSETDPYAPGATSTAAFGKHKDLMKHVATLKTDAQEGNGMDDSAAPEGTGE